MPGSEQDLGPRLLAAEVAAETAAFQRDVAWGRLVSLAGGERRAGPTIQAPPYDRIEIAPSGGEGAEPGPRAAGLRIALVATPRTGNTWIRTLLAEAYGLEQTAVHSPAALPWTGLPARLVVQLHWHRLPCFRSALMRTGFRIVTIARNPIDVLVSVLQFRQSEPTTEFWLSGEAGNEDGLLGAGPLDEAFRRWAVSDRARALLSVTDEWWSDPAAIRVRYEDFVVNPGASLLAVNRCLGVDTDKDLRTIGTGITLEDMRRRFSATPGHFWKGRPGTGLEVLDGDTARAIVAAHGRIFEGLEYAADVPDRSAEQALGAWRRLAGR